MAQYMWHAHPEANKQDWKPMQSMTHIIAYLLVCYIFHTFTTLIFTKHIENEVSIFHKEIRSTTVLAPPTLMTFILEMVHWQFIQS